MIIFLFILSIFFLFLQLHFSFSIFFLFYLLFLFSILRNSLFLFDVILFHFLFFCHLNLLSFIFSLELFFKFNKLSFYPFFTVFWNLVNYFKSIFCLLVFRLSSRSKFSVLWICSCSRIVNNWQTICVNALVLTSFISHSDFL